MNAIADYDAVKRLLSRPVAAAYVSRIARVHATFDGPAYDDSKRVVVRIRTLRFLRARVRRRGASTDRAADSRSIRRCCLGASPCRSPLKAAGRSSKLG